MNRRDFLILSASALAAGTAGSCAVRPPAALPPAAEPEVSMTRYFLTVVGGFLRNAQAPKLTIARSGNGCELSWPTHSTLFALQATAALTPPATWTTETAAPAISGTNYIVVIQATNAARFFRLRLDQ